MTATEYIAARASNYTGDSRVAVLLEEAATQIGPAYGNKAEQAKALLVLHWLTLSDDTGRGGQAGGALSKEREGSLERQYTVDFKLTLRYPDLSQTSWGMELIGLRRMCTFGATTRMITNENIVL